MSLFYLKRHITYWLTACHRHGHGIHSPYLFGLLTNVIENQGSYYAYDTIDKAWASLMRSNVQVPGSASEFEDIPEKLKLLVRRYDLLPKYGKMLFRLVNEFQPKTVICAGPVSGMSLLYLAKADSRIPVFHYDGKPELLPVTNYLLRESKVANVSVHQDLPEFSEVDLDNSFVVISYPEDPERCRDIIQSISRNQGKKPKAIVVNGIHHSPQMETLWKELIDQELVRVSLDFFTLGLAICPTDLQKENFVIRY
jgi:hypothetical protein